MFLKKLKLGQKFNLLLVIIFIAGIVLGGVTLSWTLQQRAQTEISSEAELLIEIMNSVRDYTSDQINPLLKERLETDPLFIPETVPAYSATEVFQIMRRNEAYQTFFYKEATLNPTNLRDKADNFERALVERFRQEPNLNKLSGFRDLPGGQVFYIAHPLAVNQESCLRCHSTPDVAPKSQINTYGSKNGYGWKLNEVVATQIISVPAEEVLGNTRQSLGLTMIIFIGVFGAIALVINFLLKHSVIKPISQIARTAQEVSMGNMENEFKSNAEDEIGALARAFNRMKSSLEISINLLNQREPNP
ncbi:MAG: DUF3365 domain-containing protein [Cyanobacteria bacterium P01_G01_bin.49]